MKLLLVLAIMAALTAGARADECIGMWGENTLSLDTPAGWIYVDDDLCQTAEVDPCVLSLWVYQESNGIEQLQRSDPFRDDTCGGMWPADTIVVAGFVRL